jgi:hypothetical protein
MPRYIQKLSKEEQDLPHWQTATLTNADQYYRGPRFSVSRQCRHASSPAPRQAGNARAATQGTEGLQGRQMNRIGRRTILVMLLIAALAIMWNLFGG